MTLTARQQQVLGCGVGDIVEPALYWPRSPGPDCSKGHSLEGEGLGGEVHAIAHSILDAVLGG